MRDYSFGNLISTLRERCGLSQYQLGALVGVSDKAVSKWENGISKPRLDTIRKLSEVLDVSVDDLLTCEYDTFDRKRKDLFTMKREIINKAKNRMNELYGDNPPISIENRFKQEELMLNDQDVLLWMDFFGKLQEQCDEKNMFFGFRDAKIGASFIAWLLNDMNVNPLPAHYYCPMCKKVEFVPDVSCGLDLSNKQCSCGAYYRKDGFGIEAINMYPLRKHQDIFIYNQAIEVVKNCLCEFFEGYGEVREIRLKLDETGMKFDKECTIKRFGIISRSTNSKLPDETVALSMDEYLELFDERLVLTMVEYKDENLNSWDVRNTEFTEYQLKAYCNYALEKGVFNDLGHGNNLENFVANIVQPKFSDLLDVFGLLYGLGTWNENENIQYEDGIPISKMMSCSENVYTYLYNKLNGRCCDNPSGKVFEITDNLRNGHYWRMGMPSEIETLLLECDVPKWYVERIKKIRNLSRKTHTITIVKRNVCKFLKENHM